MAFHHQCLTAAIKSFFHAILTQGYICLFISLMTLLLVLKFRKNYSTLAVSLTNSSKFVKFAASHLYLDDSVVAIEKHFMLGDGVLLASFGNVLVDSIYCLTEYYDVTSAQLTSVRLAYHVFATAYLLVLYYKQRKASYELLPTTHVEVSA